MSCVFPDGYKPNHLPRWGKVMGYPGHWFWQWNHFTQEYVLTFAPVRIGFNRRLAIQHADFQMLRVPHTKKRKRSDFEVTVVFDNESE